MKIIRNEDEELANEIQQAIKDNDGYCCCAIDHTPDTKCMCKDFRDMVTNGKEGYCHCELYKSVKGE